MVQAAQDRYRVDSALAVALGSGQRLGRRLAQALVRSVPVVVRGVLAQYPRQVALADDEEMVEALAPHAAQEALAHGVRPRGAVGRAQDLNAARLSDPGEGRPELAVVVPDQVVLAVWDIRTQLGRALRHAPVVVV